MRVLDPHAEIVPREAPPLSICKWCRRTNVYGRKWQVNDDGSGKIELRCPDCLRTRWVFATAVHVEAFDDYLNDSAMYLCTSLRDYTRQRFEEDIEDIVKALESDHLLPMDF